MRGTNLRRIAVLLLCVGFSYLLANAIRSDAHGAIRAVDFGAVYYGTRSAIDHKDPYDPGAVLREFRSDGMEFVTSSANEEREDRAVLSKIIYPPTVFLIVSPFATLHWALARTLWIGLIAGFLVLAAVLTWDLAARAPIVAGSMACFILLNSVTLLTTGNPAGIVVSFCVIAAWCFLKKRCEWAGVAILAVGLVMKPHDAGFVWFYFLLAGGPGRKRALQTLAVTAVLGLCAAIWIIPLSPHWMSELHGNIDVLSARDGPADPGPARVSARTLTPILSLQSTLSVFEDDPHFYNPVSYLIGGSLILAWAVTVLRKRATPEGALLALAAISSLTMLPVYHRADDAKLLLLSIPACAMLWAGKGATRWAALGLTLAAVSFTSTFVILSIAIFTPKMTVSPSTLAGKLTLLLLQPAPLVLLAAGCFYLWTYIRCPSQARHSPLTEDVRTRTAPSRAT